MIGSEARVREVEARPADWYELALAVAAGIFLGFSVACVMFVSTAHAGGPVALTWSQASDCGEVTGWELLVAPITTANPNPSPTSATVGVSFANSGAPCGLNMTRTVTVTSGVGPQRFWLKAYTPGAGGARFYSDVSNSADASMPLGKPSGLTVVVP